MGTEKEKEESFMKEYLPENCSCGKKHPRLCGEVVCGSGVLSLLPEKIASFGAKKVFVFADGNTMKAAGEKVCSLLEKAKIPYTLFVFPDPFPKPDEKTVGSVFLHFDPSCDLVLGVGSGVINDTGKLLSHLTKRPYIIVGTAPSMDGYASATSSMEKNGLKISLDTKCPDLIFGDTEILRNAPMKMLLAGLGDMLAKYVSLCEWRISHLINGEYYCEEVASLVRRSLKECIDHAKGLMKREEEAVGAVFNGLVLAGYAACYAGLSRPVSGVEHYFSHLWDMRGLEFGTKTDLHGIQCAIGTYYAVFLYEKLIRLLPSREKALEYAAGFSFEEWKAKLRAFIGRGAEPMIALEKEQKKYDPVLHEKRLKVILENWDEVKKIAAEELPSFAELDALYDSIGMPKDVSSFGLDPSVLPMTFKASKDIRNKYILSTLLWDLGLLDEFSPLLLSGKRKIRPAKEADMNSILRIYENARAFMADSGNPNQWGKSNPSPETVRKDLALNRLFVCEEEGNLLGVFCYFFGEEPNYSRIEGGRWQNDEPYGVMHRVAVAKDAHGKGIAAFCFDWCFSLCGNLRIDTHRDNLPMQHALKKNGFIPCGTVFLPDGSERIAFQKC